MRTSAGLASKTCLTIDLFGEEVAKLFLGLAFMIAMQQSHPIHQGCAIGFLRSHFSLNTRASHMMLRYRKHTHKNIFLIRERYLIDERNGAETAKQ